MDFVGVIDTAVNFAKDKIDKVLDIWEDMEEDKQKLIIGCAVCAVAVIVIASVFYALGTAHGKRVAFEDDEF